MQLVMNKNYYFFLQGGRGHLTVVYCFIKIYLIFFIRWLKNFMVSCTILMGIIIQTSSVQTFPSILYGG